MQVICIASGLCTGDNIYSPGQCGPVCPAYPSWIKTASGAWLDGSLYVIGASPFEPDKRVFRSTLMSGYEPQYPVSIKDAKVVLVKGQNS